MAIMGPDFLFVYFQSERAKGLSVDKFRNRMGLEILISASFDLKRLLIPLVIKNVF